MSVSNLSLIHEHLLADGFNLINAGKYPPIYQGFLKLKKSKIACEIHVVDTDFIRLPKLKILDDKLIDKSIAHFDEKGFYCYVGNGENIINKYSPKEAILSHINMMKDAVEAHLINDLTKDIIQEFSQHWHSKDFYMSELSKSKDRHALLREVNNDSGTSAIIVECDAKYSCIGDFSKGKKRHVKIVNHSKDLTFLDGQKQPNSLKELIYWANTQGDNLGGRIVSSLDFYQGDLIDTVFIEANNALIGFCVDLLSLPKDLTRKSGFNKGIKRLSQDLVIERLLTKKVSNDIIFKRNTKDMKTNLEGKKIALLGCGTIGSHLAKMLVQSGAGTGNGKIILVDNQNLEAENVGRHFLGVNRIGQNKALACEKELTRLFPNCNIRGVKANIQDSLDELYDFDLLIDATGEEPLSVVVNEWLKKQQISGNKIEGVFVWLFGNAIAAQALLVQNDDNACYKCLKPKHDGVWRSDPRKHPETIKEIVGACGESTYVPYGVSGSCIAAALCCNMVLEWANESYSPRLRTMRIDIENTKLIKNKNLPVSEVCPCCSKYKS